MQGYVIDTNVLYYLSGVSTPQSLDVHVLDRELKELKPLFVSELSLLELFTHRNFGLNQFDAVFKCMDNRKIRRVNFLPPDPAFFAMAVFTFSDDKTLSHIKDRALAKRCEIETKLMTAVLNSAVAIMSFYYHYESRDEGVKQKIILQAIALTQGNLHFLELQIGQILKDFYNDSISESRFKDEVQSLLLTLMYVLSMNNNLAKNGMLNSDLKDIIDPSDRRLSAFRKDRDNDKILAHLLSKIRGKKPHGILAKKEFWANLVNSVSVFMNALQATHNTPIAQYYGGLLDRIFRAGKHIEKNSLIDSQFLEYWPKFKLITFDNDLTASLESFDKDHYDYLRKLQRKTKKT